MSLLWVCVCVYVGVCICSLLSFEFPMRPPLFYTTFDETTCPSCTCDHWVNVCACLRGVCVCVVCENERDREREFFLELPPASLQQDRAVRGQQQGQRELTYMGPIGIHGRGYSFSISNRCTSHPFCLIQKGILCLWIGCKGPLWVYIWQDRHGNRL